MSVTAKVSVATASAGVVEPSRGVDTASRSPSAPAFTVAVTGPQGGAGAQWSKRGDELEMGWGRGSGQGGERPWRAVPFQEEFTSFVLRFTGLHPANEVGVGRPYESRSRLLPLDVIRGVFTYESNMRVFVGAHRVSGRELNRFL